MYVYYPRGSFGSRFKFKFPVIRFTVTTPKRVFHSANTKIKRKSPHTLMRTKIVELIRCIMHVIIVLKPWTITIFTGHKYLKYKLFQQVTVKLVEPINFPERIGPQNHTQFIEHVHIQTTLFKNWVQRLINVAYTDVIINLYSSLIYLIRVNDGMQLTFSETTRRWKYFSQK